MPVTISVGKPDSNGQLEVVIVETGSRDTTEVGPIVDDDTGVKVPARGTIMRFSAKLVSGTGTTIDPEMGTEATWTTGDALEEVLASNALAPIAQFSDQSPVRYFDSDRELYLRSNPDDVATDHEIRTTILIKEGWEV